MLPCTSCSGKVPICVHVYTTTCTRLYTLYLYVGRVSEKHAETIDADPPASCRRKAILKGSAEILVYCLGLCLWEGERQEGRIGGGGRDRRRKKEERRERKEKGYKEGEKAEKR